MILDGKKFGEALNTLVNSGEISDGAYNLVWNRMGACKLPIQPPVEDPEPRRRARIEAAIRKFDKPDLKDRFYVAGGCADLCRYFLGQPQETWKDKDFGLEEETKN